MNLNLLLKFWGFGIFLLFAYITFQVGALAQQKESKQQISQINRQNNRITTNLGLQLNKKDNLISQLNSQINDFVNKEQNLNRNIEQLRGQVMGLSAKPEYPFAVPTNGWVGTYNGSFGGNMHGTRHLGVDIWTSLENSGRRDNHLGNLVYSACDGIVEGIDPANAAITIKCNPIEGNYNIPATEVFTHYTHMGNAETKQLYIYVHPGQQIVKRQFLGYQGDLSSYFPEMRNVHLHFSVFTGLSETDKRGGALNPCLYIGGNCSLAGEEFKLY